jgi:hypothetical protein
MNEQPNGPSEVMIIRHGEKLGDPAEDSASGGRHLSVRGSARAAALPSLFLPQGPSTPECKLALGQSAFSAAYEEKTIPSPAPRFSTPDFIFATAASHHSDRPIETVTPTAAALGLDIDDSYSNSSDDIARLANDILTKSDYAGKVVLICWHHGTIDALATALQGTGAQKWHGSVFDRLWLMDYAGSSTPAIQQFGQELLFTDERDVPSAPW